jgi:OOP family OmpA-OmpF porin
MTQRFIAFAGAALCMLATPALAGDGWYLGLGAGWDSRNDVQITDPLGSGTLSTNDNALVIGSIGYKFPDMPFRLEAEGGYDWHNLRQFDFNGVSIPASGHSNLGSALLNAIYDIPIADRWAISVGAGAGASFADTAINSPIATTSGDTHFMWQGIGGITYEVNPQIDLFVDYRYRDDMAAHNMSLPGGASVHVGDATENAVLAGLRWYVWAPPPPPPPAPPSPPPAPPPPPPPPAMKTFIVFFDFNRSDLTSEAQQVVSEAVKTAKETGAVRVLVTGHTDTVGSDSYNQGLSVRRAESVKDAMVQQGMDGSTISIQGKSFHDPLVATGPGVREPQNRRAVIDLGGG